MLINPQNTTESSLEIKIDSSDLENKPAEQKSIHSFVRRQSRITPAQQRALTELWQRFGVETDGKPLYPEQLFGRKAPLTLEIGFGNGESLITMAMNTPEINFLGIEVHRPGIGHLLLRAAALSLTNLRVMEGDARQILEQQLLDTSIERIQIFFPDPWPKMRHRKRRLIQAPFLSLLARKLKPSGLLHVATDCESYAYAIRDSLIISPEWVNTVEGHEFAPRPGWRPLTKFEQRGHCLGHNVWDLVFKRRSI